MVAVLAEDRLQHGKVDGAHLRSQNGVALPAHLLRKFPAGIGRQTGLGLNLFLPAHIHGCQQGTDADAHCTQVVHFVNFQQSVKFVALFQNFTDLVGGDCVQTAAEGGQLYQFQIVPVADKFCSSV